MAIRWELTADAARGPGFGLLKAAGLPLTEGPVRLWVQRNQGAEPYLGRGRAWATQPVYHELPPPVILDGFPAFSLGPDLVDPIALLPPNCMVLIGFEAGGAKDQGRVTIRRLLPSAAAGEGNSGASDVVRHDPPPLSVAPAPEPEPAPEPVVETPVAEPLVAEPRVADPAVLVDAPKSKLSPAVLAMIAALLLVGGAGGLYFAGLPPFAAKTTETTREVAPVAAKPVDASADGAIDSREALARYLAANPAAEAALAKAKELEAQGKRDFAMLVYQYASRQGSAAASLTLGRMYDPDTWSKETSPMERPDAETAAYWYEPAARAGNVEAQRRLGKILVALPQGGIQKDKGKEWLSKAAEAGDAEAKSLLAALK